MVRIVDKLSEDLLRENRDWDKFERLLDSVPKTLEFACLEEHAPHSFGLMFKAAGRVLIERISVLPHSNDIYVYYPKYLEKAVGLAEFYEKRFKEEFTVIREYR